MPIIFFSQQNTLTGSPYSLFGLGTESSSNVGRNSGMGDTGIAMKSDLLLNVLNPASFADIPKQRFLFDVGIYSELNEISTSRESEIRLTTNFSNINFGFALDENSGIGLSLIPKTSVGYSLIGIQTSIEGSNDQYTSNILGEGGINDLKLTYGRKFFDILNLGLYASYNFGKIEENENIIAGESFLNIERENFYSGFRFGGGLQFEPFKTLQLGFVIDSPSNLKGSRDQRVQKSLDFIPFEVEDENDLDTPDFKLPLELGTGITYQIKSNFFFNLDYKRKFWDDTKQSDNIGDYVDQDLMGIGISYTTDPTSLSYLKRIELRGGFSYNSGYLQVNSEQIDSFEGSIGVGLPFSRFNSVLNISYSRGLRGSTNGILIQENYNLLNFNLSFNDVWFVKRKFN
ncbi:membrane protein [Gangjinia marincola]|uniref:Membrane protein n=1 Tax=Gangjinia marincola TaxID=578463 RepID=A0ABN1MIB8_9FLAO